jgi:hypothetical protein
LVKKINANNLEIQPKHFWECISKFKKSDQSVTQTEPGKKMIMEPQFTADRVSSIFTRPLPLISRIIPSFSVFHISLIQTLSELLIAIIRRNASDQMKFLIL